MKLICGFLSFLFVLNISAQDNFAQKELEYVVSEAEKQGFELILGDSAVLGNNKTYNLEVFELAANETYYIVWLLYDCESCEFQLFYKNHLSGKTHHLDPEVKTFKSYLRAEFAMHHEENTKVELIGEVKSSTEIPYRTLLFMKKN